MESTLLLHRIHFAFTVTFHYLFPQLTMGLAPLILVFKTMALRSGNDFWTSPFVVPPGAPLVKALSHSGDLIAIGELKIPNLYHPGTVL